MNRPIVVDTSPLIALGKMQAFELISQLPYQFICPSQVEAEISAGTVKGYPVSIPSWIMVSTLKTCLSQLALANLDAGEAAVIELALERNIETVCLDELKGRRAALASGLKVVGSLGLIGNAKHLGLVASVRPLVERAQDSGIYYDTKLVENFLKALGE
jgi:predicted nucleic acid-binding protein